MHTLENAEKLCHKLFSVIEANPELIGCKKLPDVASTIVAEKDFDVVTKSIPMYNMLTGVTVMVGVAVLYGKPDINIDLTIEKL